MATLLPKLRVYFAEFLNASSLVRLRILISPTCVGLRYGLLLPNLRDYFSSPWLHPLRLPVGRLDITAQLKWRICLPLSTPCCLYQDYHRLAALHLMRHPIETKAGTGI